MDKKTVYALLFFSGMICTVTCFTPASPEIAAMNNDANTTNTPMTTVANMTKSSNSEGNDNSTELQNTTLTTQNLQSLSTAQSTFDTKNMTDIMTTPAGSIFDSTTPVTTTSVTPQPNTTAKQKSSAASLKTGLIILFIFIALILVMALYCWLQYRKRERNSFNLYQASPDNADIPLSSDAVEKKAADNLKEDKVDIHHIEPPSEPGDSPKQGQSSDPADAPEGDVNSTASTVPKDDEPDRLSQDSSQASLLPPGTGNLKTQETDQSEDGSGVPSSGSSVESPSGQPNENNSNSNKWAIYQLTTDERDPFMRGQPRI
ncbi:hypothetical protein NDU88_004298 [Pleurodeles waltl]|uniref:Uncharacterized protein n=1 Tax=Pleurodeles waltl TaxID=8319 RepID=A0AAV7WRG3_PLEWA|nr:hypothetical protein NDU88_004298 [Pleurodeles waltl]